MRKKAKRERCSEMNKKVIFTEDNKELSVGVSRG